MQSVFQKPMLPANIETVFLPLISVKKLKNIPVRRFLGNVPIVIWRANGEICAALDKCPHRNFPLSKGYVENGKLVCPYHGWEFGNDGKCTEVPGCPNNDLSGLGLETIEIKTIWGMVFGRLKYGEGYQLPEMPNDADFDHFWWELEPINARPFDAIENVLDPFHTNFIHDGLIRVKNRRQKVTQTIEVFEDGFKGTYVQNSDYGAMSRFLEGGRTFATGQYYPPLCYQGQWHGNKGLNHCVTIWFCPEGEGKMRAYARFSMAKHKGPKWLKVLLVRLFLFKVIEQDRDALIELKANIDTFGAPKFKAGPGDKISGFLARLYNGQKLEPQTIGPFEINL